MKTYFLGTARSLAREQLRVRIEQGQAEKQSTPRRARIGLPLHVFVQRPPAARVPTKDSVSSLWCDRGYDLKQMLGTEIRGLRFGNSNAAVCERRIDG